MSEPRDTVVVTGNGGSTGAILLGLIVLIVVLIGAWYLFMGPGAARNDNPTDVNVQVQLPTPMP